MEIQDSEKRQTMKILNFGSINIDYVYSVQHIAREGETISSNCLNVFSGGKGFNQSIAISRAGHPIYHAGFIGEDGIFLKEKLRESGVNVEFVDVVNVDRTGNAIIQKDDYGRNCILLYPGANRKITQDKIDSVLHFFCSGDFLILQNEISELSYLMQKAHKKEMQIVLNPSPLDDTVLACPLEYVKYFIVNEIEGYGLLGLDRDEEISHEELLQRLANKYPQSVIILTVGEKGSYLAENGTIYQQESYKVHAVDTTAAGDTFTGYFIAGIANGMPIYDVMQNAAKASAIAVSRMGAEPSIPRFEELGEIENCSVNA